MSVERRGSVRTSLACAQLITDQEEAVTKTKPFTIDKWQVVRAYELVKANAGAAGIDQQSIIDRILSDNSLFQIEKWPHL